MNELDLGTVLFLLVVLAVVLLFRVIGGLRKDLPFKIAEYDSQNKQYRIIGSKWTFAEAYSQRRGTHVIQTHGTDAELQ